MLIFSFVSGNLVVLACNANGIYELLSTKAGDGNAHYLLDPDCSETWQAEMEKKEPFLGQICYISESIVSVCFYEYPCCRNLTFRKDIQMNTKFHLDKCISWLRLREFQNEMDGLAITSLVTVKICYICDIIRD
jgi:hypothetical protein